MTITSLDDDKSFPFLLILGYIAGIIFGRDIERFAHFSDKNLVENGLIEENLIAKCNKSKDFAKISL